MKKILLVLVLFMTLTSFGATTWNGATWSNGIPAFNDDVIINGNYTVGVSNGATNFFCKSMVVNAGFTFRIKSGFYMNVGNNAGAGNLTNNGIFVVESGADFWIYVGSLINNSPAANFTIESGGAFVQINNAAVNTGAVTFKRNTNPVKEFEYTYWSSPVAGKTMCSLPPATINSVFTYTYPSPLPYDGWIEEPCANTMTLGKGYAVRGQWCSPYPSCFGAMPQVTYTADFVGVPNNGVINIVSNSTNNLHFLGNPYGSSLRASSFMVTNPSVSVVYLWTHNTVLSGSITGNWMYNFTSDDYALWNSTGGVGASSPILDSTPNNSNVPNGNIGTAQGFFVKCNTNGAKTFTFHDGQRGFLPTSNNVQFFKNGEETNRIWLFLTNNTGITRYNLVGYVTGATNDFDHQYDAESMSDRINSIYSINQDKKLVIQGKSLPFNVNDQIPLGMKLAEGGTFTVGLNDVDGLFTDVSQPIYIQDNLLGTTHNLRDGVYNFTAVQGITEDRFVLKFTNTLGVHDYEMNNLIVYSQGETVVIKSSEELGNVKIYDILGRELYNKTVTTSELVVPNIPQGVLIIKINERNIKKFLYNKK